MLLSILQAAAVKAQSKLLLQHKRKPHRVKALDLSRTYQIRTTDTTYATKIVGFTDSIVMIPVRIKTGKDTVYIHTYTSKYYPKSNFFPIGHAKDTTITLKTVVPLYRDDTTAIAFSDIQVIKKDWFKNRQWLAPFGWIMIGPVIGTVLLPAAAIDEGKEGVKNWAEFEGILLGIAGPPIFIGTRKTKYDLRKKWELRTVISPKIGSDSP
jgi:hypothetical protein